MKRMIVTVCIIAAALTQAAAASAHGCWQFVPSYEGIACRSGECRYIDRDGDGICDLCKSGINYVDSDNNGVCDNYDGGLNAGGANYVDSDNDGVCDNYSGGHHGGGHHRRAR